MDRIMDTTGPQLFNQLYIIGNDSVLKAAMHHPDWDAGFDAALRFDELPFRRKDVSDAVLLAHLISSFGCEFYVNDDSQLACESRFASVVWLNGMWVTVD